MRKPAIVAVLLLALLSVAGCASHRAAVNGGASDSAFAPTGQVNYVPVAKTEHGGGVVVTPPRSGDLPKITADEALKVCPEAGCASGQLPEIRLGRATADGSLPPIMNDTLVFELVWTGPRCLPAGHGGTSTEMPTLEYYACTTVVLVDATNGADLTTLTQGTH